MYFMEKIIPTFAKVSQDDNYKITKLQSEVEQGKSQTAQLQLQTRSEIKSIQDELDGIRASKGWRLLSRAYAMKSKIQPKRVRKP